jgi:hypothetical protein
MSVGPYCDTVNSPRNTEAVRARTLTASMGCDGLAYATSVVILNGAGGAATRPPGSRSVPRRRILSRCFQGLPYCFFASGSAKAMYLFKICVGCEPAAPSGRRAEPVCRRKQPEQLVGFVPLTEARDLTSPRFEQSPGLLAVSSPFELELLGGAYSSWLGPMSQNGLASASTTCRAQRRYPETPPR